MSASTSRGSATNHDISQTSARSDLANTLSSPALSAHHTSIDANANLVSPPLGTPQPYELININKDLMRFADPETLHSPRLHASLTRMGVVAPEPSVPSERMIHDGVRLLNSVLDLVSEVGLYTLEPSTEDQDIMRSANFGKIAWRTTQITLQKLLKDRSPANLERECRSILQRTSQPPVFPSTPGHGALQAAFSDLRIEHLGIFCAALGVYLGDDKDLVDNYAAHKSWKVDRKTLMQMAYQRCRQCESLAHELGAVNDFSLWFSLLLVFFGTWVFGVSLLTRTFVIAS